MKTMKAEKREKLQRKLSQYYELQAHKDLTKITKEEARSVWKPVVENLLEYVKQRDDRFDINRNPVYVGSFYDRTKTKRPDEFDVMLELNVKKFITQKAQGLSTKVRICDEIEQENWSRDGCLQAGNYLNASKVKEILSGYIKEFMESHTVIRSEVTAEYTGTPVATLYFKHPKFKGSVDLTLAIKDSEWPVPALAKISYKLVEYSWPSSELASKIVESGCYLVTTKNEYGGIEWSYTFSQAEKMLLNEGSAGQSNNCRKKVLVILKSLRQDLGMTGLTSYHLKTLMFHEFVKYPNPKLWTTDKLNKRFNSARHRLLSCIKRKTLYHFFDPSINLFENMNNSTKRLRKLLINAENYL